MNLQTIANAILILLLVGFIGYRQLKWRPIAVARMWRQPIILGVIGLFVASSQSKGSTLSSLDIGVLVVEFVVALGIGALMGRLAQFRPLSNSTDPQAPEFESRTGLLGTGLWIVMIAVRVGIDLWASGAGSTVAASTGIILVMLAANRIARTAVFAARVAKLDAVRV
jgi:hypothetical protein